MVKIYITVILFLFLVSFDASAQKPRFIFQHLTQSDGLSESTVRGINQDSKGFMWFATEDGINKYDGKSFTIYRNSPTDNYSISNNSCKSILRDKKGRLWFVTRGGVNIYDEKNDRFLTPKTHKGLTPINGDIQGIAEDRNGNIWVAAAEEGLFKIQSLNESPENYQFKSNDYSEVFLCSIEDQEGNIWIGTRNGLLIFDVKSKKFTDLKPFYGNSYQVRNLQIFDGQIWAITSSGLKLINQTTGVMTEYKHDHYNKQSLSNNNTVEVVRFKDGNYLIAIDGGGIDYFDKKNEVFYHYNLENESQLNSNNITAIFMDSTYGIWAGTFLNGINYSNTSSNLFSHIKNKLYSPKDISKGIVSSFLQDSQGNFWVTTDGGGIFLKKRGEENYINFTTENQANLYSNKFIKMVGDETGLWLTTYTGGLVHYSYENNAFRSYLHDPNDPNSISGDKLNGIIIYNNEVWVSSFGTGVAVFNKETKQFRNYKHDKLAPTTLPTDWVHTFLKDSKGNLWLGTFNGLCRYIPEKDCFKTIYFDKNINHEANFIYEIIESKDNQLWLGTKDAGLIKFNPENEKFEIINTSNGLLNNNIRSLIIDDLGLLWMTTNNGIVKFNPYTHEVKNYNHLDGVPPVAFFFSSKYKTRDGRIFFGANNGYVDIDPKSASTNLHRPIVVLTDLKIGNKNYESFRDENPTLANSILHTNSIELPHHQNALTFEFVALNFNNSIRNNYKYTLEGFDEKWIDVGNQNFATFTNLNPGTYIFRVKASNNDGIWNEKGTTLTITIHPPFWNTWWFYLIEFVAIILIVYLTIRWRVKQVKIKNNLLEELIEKRTSELKESNDQLEAFVYKASHDIKGPLKSIIGLTTIGQKDVKDPVALTYLEHILKSTNKLDKLLMELLQLSKVKQAKVESEKINFEEILSEVLGSFKHLPDYNNLLFSIDIDQKQPFLSDKKLLQSIIQNLVENAIKYRDDEKKASFLKIKITSNNKLATIIFSDNGIGIPKELQQKVFDMFYKVSEESIGTGLGLYIVKTTVEKLKGNIQLSSTQGKGTVFTLNLPQVKSEVNRVKELQQNS